MKILRWNCNGKFRHKFYEKALAKASAFSAKFALQMRGNLISLSASAENFTSLLTQLCSE